MKEKLFNEITKESQRYDKQTCNEELKGRHSTALTVRTQIIILAIPSKFVGSLFSYVGICCLKPYPVAGSPAKRAVHILD